MPKEIEGKNADEWNNEASSYFSLKEFQKVVECYENALKLGLKDKVQRKLALSNLGSAYLRLENYQKANEAYKKLVKFEPNFTIGWYGVGFTSFHLKDYKEAIKCLEKSLKVDPKNPNLRPNYEAVFRLMGDSYKELQNAPKAIECYKRVLEINPDNEEVKKSLIALKKEK